MSIVWIAVYLLLTVSGLTFIKLGADSVHLSFARQISMSMNWQSVVGFFCYLASFALYTFKILKDFDLSYITPITMGTSQILILVTAHFVFKEEMNALTFVAVGLIIAGVVLLNVKIKA